MHNTIETWYLYIVLTLLVENKLRFLLNINKYCYKNNNMILWCNNKAAFKNLQSVLNKVIFYIVCRLLYLHKWKMRFSTKINCGIQSRLVVNKNKFIYLRSSDSVRRDYTVNYIHLGVCIMYIIYDAYINVGRQYLSFSCKYVYIKKRFSINSV